MKKLLRFVLTFVLIFALVMAADYVLRNLAPTGDTAAPSDELTLLTDEPSDELTLLTDEPEGQISEDGEYDTRDEVALYIHTYGHLPANFVTKKEAEAAGWSGGSVEKVLPGKCIGGDRYYNREGLLPDAKGRIWTECDIDTLGASSRGAKRIVFSNDGLIYYTSDHYDSFTLLYGEP